MSIGDKAVNRFERERLARNLAEAIDELYKSDVERDHRRMIALIAKQIDRAMYLGYRSARKRESYDDD